MCAAQISFAQEVPAPAAQQLAEQTGLHGQIPAAEAVMMSTVVES